MSASFGRRKAKVIGSADASEDPGDDSHEPVVKRPALKGKKRSAVKVSFGGGTSMTEDDDGATEVFVPKRGGLGRHALSNSARRREQDGDQPTYSKNYLEELRNSTPVAPQPKESQAVDVAAKFGSTALSTYGAGGTSLIPTDAEIREKKARRARLAAEHRARGDGSSSGSDEGRDEPATDSDDDFKAQRDTIAFRPEGSGTVRKRNVAAPRLVRDDEDFMELEEDDANYGSAAGTVALSRRAARAEQAAARQQMRALIDDAHSDANNSSDGERAAYDAAQTQRGLGHAVREEGDGARIPRLATLPHLSTVIDALQDRLAGIAAEIAADTKRLEDVGAERAALDEQEGAVDTLLGEIQQRWQQLVDDGVVPDRDLQKGRLLEQYPHAAAAAAAAAAEVAVQGGQGVERLGTTGMEQ